MESRRRSERVELDQKLADCDREIGSLKEVRSQLDRKSRRVDALESELLLAKTRIKELEELNAVAIELGKLAELEGWKRSNEVTRLVNRLIDHSEQVNERRSVESVGPGEANEDGDDGDDV